MRSFKQLLQKNYSAHTVYMEDKDVDALCDIADDYFYENEQVIIEILQTDASCLQPFKKCISSCFANKNTVTSYRGASRKSSISLSNDVLHV